MVLMMPLGSITNTARTAWVLDEEGWIIPNLLATSILISSISGNVTSIFFIPFHSNSWIFRNQAIWAYSESTESPTSSVFKALNSSIIEAKVMNSVVHTGVKSAGWENKITHLPL